MNKRKFLRIAGVVLSLLLLIGGMAYNNYSKPRQVSYRDFINKVDKHQIEEVVIGTGSKLQFKEGGILYETDHPRTEGFKEKLLLKDVKVIEKTHTEFTMVQNILSMGLMLLAFVMIYKAVKKQGLGKGSMSLCSKPIEPSSLQQDFGSIAGNEEAKGQVQDIIDFMRNPDKYRRLGARMPKGVIL